MLNGNRPHKCTMYKDITCFIAAALIYITSINHYVAFGETPSGITQYDCNRFYSMYYSSIEVYRQLALNVPALNQEAKTSAVEYAKYMKPYSVQIDAAMAIIATNELQAQLWKKDLREKSKVEVYNNLFSSTLTPEQYERLLNSVNGYKIGHMSQSAKDLINKLNKISSAGLQTNITQSILTQNVASKNVAKDTMYEVITDVEKYLRENKVPTTHEVIRIGNTYTVVMPSKVKKTISRVGLVDIVKYESDIPFNSPMQYDEIYMRVEALPLHDPERALVISNLESQMRETFTREGYKMNSFQKETNTTGYIAMASGTGLLKGLKATLDVKWVIGESTLVALMVIEPMRGDTSVRARLFLSSIRLSGASL